MRGVAGGGVGWADDAPHPPSLRGALATKQSISPRRKNGLLRFARNDGRHTFTISRLNSPEACYRISLPSRQRAQGMPGARCTRGLVCDSANKAAHEHTGQRRTSDIPCAVALRLISCSPQSGRARCHCRRAGREPLRNLTPASGASGPHDFTVRLCRARRSQHRRPPHPTPRP